MLTIYLAANSLHVHIDNEGVRTTRRVFGFVTNLRAITRSDVADIEPRIAARHQNVFSSIPRYALIARHVQSGLVVKSVVSRANNSGSTASSLNTGVTTAMAGGGTGEKERQTARPRNAVLHGPGAAPSRAIQGQCEERR